ncbi:MAG: hypothetical protein KIC63_05540 [Clostridium sp.]|nr:hypothetical protein [Clostridium sp.]
MHWARFRPERHEVGMEYLAGDGAFFCESQNRFSHIALEELLLAEDRLILHASFIESRFGGLLFTGPCGVGKSTQAALWERFEDACLINGDRPVLSRGERGWTAHGSPYAGSSRCFINRSLPVRAIVALSQGERCDICRIGLGEAFRRLYAGTTLNTWNAAYVERACTLLGELAAAVPVYRMQCTPDEAAVKTLRAELEKAELEKEGSRDGFKGGTL